MRPDTDNSMQPDFHEVIDAVEIHSDSEYRIGETLRDLSRVRLLPGSDSAQPLMLPRLLENDIYGLLYKRSVALPPSPRFAGRRSDFLIAVSRGNCGQGTWEPGWKLLGRSADGLLRVASGRVAFEVETDAVRMSREQQEGPCRVLVPKEARQLNAHYYMAFGDGELRDPAEEQDVLMRYYWHLDAESAVDYMALITARLNAARIPFRTKVLSDPDAYGAADAGVLYIDRRHRSSADPVVLAVHADIGDRLAPSVPLFTQTLRPGLGYAEDPDTGDSFGISRARLAAAGLWRAFQHGDTAVRARLQHLCDAFVEAGYDPTRPHLQPAAPSEGSTSP